MVGVSFLSLRIYPDNAQDNPVRGENMDNEKQQFEHLGSSDCSSDCLPVFGDFLVQENKVLQENMRTLPINGRRRLTLHCQTTFSAAPLQPFVIWLFGEKNFLDYFDLGIATINPIK
jgi:hypothetical protein